MGGTSKSPTAVYLKLSLTSRPHSVAAAIASGIFTAKINAQLVPTISSFASDAGVSVSDLASVVAAVAAAGGEAVIIPGITPTQIAAAQLGRLTAFANSYQYLFISVIPWTVVGAIGECSVHSHC